jgi:hypothetical protein
VFDLRAWRQADITRVYHYWQKQVPFFSVWFVLSFQLVSPYFLNALKVLY